MNFNLPKFSETSKIDENFKPIITYSVEKVFSKGLYLYDKYAVQAEGNIVIELLNDVAGGQTDLYQKVLNAYNNILKDGQCAITNISMGTNKGYGIVPYVINCDCYDFGGGAEGFVDLKSEINTSYSPQDNSLQVTRTIEGKGFANTFDNMDKVFNIIRSRVEALASTSFSINPLNKASISSNAIALISKRTIEDPVNGTYSIVEQYGGIKDGSSFKKPIVRVSVSRQDNLQTNSTINVSAQIIYREVKSKSAENILNQERAIFIVKEIYKVPKGFNLIDVNYKDDAFNGSADIQLTYSNDERIDKDGFLQEQSLSFSVDYTSATSEMSYVSSLKPVFGNIGSSGPSDESRQVIQKIGFNTEKFRLLSKSKINEKPNDLLSKDKALSIKWNKAQNMIGGSFTTAPDAYNVNLAITADLGTAQASYTPVLDGEGKYYVEDLDFQTRNKVNAKISASIPPTKTPPTQKMIDLLKEELQVFAQNDNIVLKDNIDTYMHDNKEKSTAEVTIEFEVSSLGDKTIGEIRPV